MVDYLDGKDLGVVEPVAESSPRLKTEFKEHLLLEVSESNLLKIRPA